MPIWVLADDLSGAAELAGAAVRFGYRAEVCLNLHGDDNHSLSRTELSLPRIDDRDQRTHGSGDEHPSATKLSSISNADRQLAIDVDGSHTQPFVMCIDTDSRGMDVQLSMQSVNAWLAALELNESRRYEDGNECLFKKTDSLLRGHVAAEIQIILNRLGLSECWLCPANPSRSRTIRNGQYWIGDVLLDQTIHRRDPMFPRWTSDVQTLVGDDSGRIQIPDIESQIDLDRIARELPRSALPAGGIDFFIAWLQQQRATVETYSTPHLQGPACMVCGSLAAWKSSRREFADRYGIRTLLLGCEAETIEKPIGLIAIGDENRLTSRSTQHSELENQQRGRSANDLQSTQGLERALARWLIRLRLSNRWNTLFIEGGATARAIVEELRCYRLVCVGEIGPGCTVLKPADGEPLTLVVKPGSYPWPEFVWEFVSTANR